VGGDEQLKFQNQLVLKPQNLDLVATIVREDVTEDVTEDLKKKKKTPRTGLYKVRTSQRHHLRNE